MPTPRLKTKISTLTRSSKALRAETSDGYTAYVLLSRSFRSNEFTRPIKVVFLFCHPGRCLTRSGCQHSRALHEAALLENDARSFATIRSSRQYGYYLRTLTEKFCEACKMDIEIGNDVSIRLQLNLSICLRKIERNGLSLCPQTNTLHVKVLLIKIVQTKSFQSLLLPLKISSFFMPLFKQLPMN